MLRCEIYSNESRSFDYFMTKHRSVNLKNVENQLLDNHRVKWSNKMQTVSKLRTYREFKYEFKEKQSTFK